MDQKYAILSHEIAHYYLHVHGIGKNETRQNELLTEIAAVFLGFGLIMLKGYDYVNFKSSNNFKKVGYVDSKIIIESIIQTAIYRRQNPFLIINELKFPSNWLARYKLKNLISEYKKHKKNKSA